MSEWRNRALRDFPEHRPAIERVDSAHGVFFELLPALHDAYRAIPLDESFITRIFAFASWCLSAERHRDVRGAALASFYEHLPEFGPAWRDVHNRMAAAELATLREHLRGYLDPAAFERAMKELAIAAKRVP